MAVQKYIYYPAPRVVGKWSIRGFISPEARGSTGAPGARPAREWRPRRRPCGVAWALGFELNNLDAMITTYIFTWPGPGPWEPNRGGPGQKAARPTPAAAGRRSLGVSAAAVSTRLVTPVESEAALDYYLQCRCPPPVPGALGPSRPGFLLTLI